MNIIPVIRDLLLRNQKAVIPGLGAFVLSQRPAQLNKVTRVLTPPSLTVRFDGNQIKDDGQLSGYLTRRLKQTPETARQAIDDFRASVESELKEKGSIVLEGLGTLAPKKSGGLSFTPEDELLKRIGIFEMPRIDVPPPTAPPLSDKTITHLPVAPLESPVYSQPPSRRRWIIPIILLVLLGGMLGIIYATGNMGMFVSDIKSFFGVAQKDTARQLVFGNEATVLQDTALSDTLRNQVSRQLDEQTDRARALAYKEQEPAPAQAEPDFKEPQAVTRTTSVVSSKPYHIIAGSFSVPGNAEKLKQSLDARGIDAEILPKQGKLYMVSVGSFNTSAEAAVALNKMESQLKKELWVMKKSGG